jgi:hypothetical protein
MMRNYWFVQKMTSRLQPNKSRGYASIIVRWK